MASAEGLPASTSIPDAVASIRDRIAEVCARGGRDPGEVTLVAVTKGVEVEAIRAARDAGVEDLAENYARDLARKAEVVPGRWHFIGKLQAGTAAKVSDVADVIHSAEPGRGLERVAGRAARDGRTIPCLAQVDYTGRRQGVQPEELEAFLEAAGRMAGIRIIGLMTVPPPTPSPEGARPYFAALRELRHGLIHRWPDLLELSMGMSGDYSIAVEEGATMVRVGTALFGDRPMRRAPAGDRGPSPGPSAT